MKHRIAYRTLGRVKEQREAMFRNMADSLITHGSIRTTVAKAKELRKFVEPIITKAKTGTLASRRNIQKFLYTDTAINKVMNEIGPKFKERSGGYTRVTKIGSRLNDAAEMAIIEIV
jgi:large subunit ribosomal protein L17